MTWRTWLIMLAGLSLVALSLGTVVASSVDGVELREVHIRVCFLGDPPVGCDRLRHDLLTT